MLGYSIMVYTVKVQFNKLDCRCDRLHKEFNIKVMVWQGYTKVKSMLGQQRSHPCDQMRYIRVDERSGEMQQRTIWLTNGHAQVLYGYEALTKLTYNMSRLLVSDLHDKTIKNNFSILLFIFSPVFLVSRQVGENSIVTCSIFLTKTLA